MQGQSRPRTVPVLTVLLLCYSVGNVLQGGWWLLHMAGQSSCPLDNEVGGGVGGAGGSGGDHGGTLTP